MRLLFQVQTPSLEHHALNKGILSNVSAV